jgi:tRNA pseudouridine38-40 synthase
MPVYRMGLAYDGSGFRGYARQEGQPTVQGALEHALTTVLGFPVETAVAGRTDAGVHARGQVVSFSADEGLDTKAVARSLNGILGPTIAINDLDPAGDGFHARFSAIFRRYRYLVSTAAAPDPLTRGHVWHVGRSLDLPALGSVAAAVLGEHDFSSFCRSEEGRDNTRRVDDARWEADGGLLTFWIQANAFCHQMVRSIVGLAYDVGRGFTDPAAVPSIIESRDRGRVATVAPPHGLTLWQVGYPTGDSEHA